MDGLLVAPILICIALFLQLFHLRVNKKVYTISFLLFALSHVAMIVYYHNKGVAIYNYKVIIEIVSTIVALLIIYYALYGV